MQINCKVKFQILQKNQNSRITCIVGHSVEELLNLSLGKEHKEQLNQLATENNKNLPRW